MIIETARRLYTPGGVFIYMQNKPIAKKRNPREESTSIITSWKEKHLLVSQCGGDSTH